MPFEEFEHSGTRYAVLFMYSVPDAAWCVELSESVPAPATWSDIRNAETHLPGPAFISAIVPERGPDQGTDDLLSSRW
ncbi:hypothetical protein HII36_06470 [Nonomuraea sp. NN258]|uniref:hypothetical protein n=1 Tax=Nonomuraea antri TaxID=2730852 RepID=UPI0015692644|nr:hypothetical protein [Nonomuraea antri]NRQ31485.1 hypothetical protein [Nonomuraea antri]